MQKPWFKKFGWIYYPVSVVGYFFTILTLLFWVLVYFGVESGSKNASEIIQKCFPYFVVSFTIFYWIASNSDKK